MRVLLAMTTGGTYALPVAADVNLMSVAPLLAGFETDTEATGGVAVAGREAVALGGAQAEADGGTRHRQPVVRRPRHLRDTQHVKIGGKNLWRRRLVFARTGTA